MKIVLAPDSFKESLSALQVCKAMARGVRSVLPDADIIHLPLADGGEGTVDALVSATNGRLLQQEVVGPLGDNVTARFGVLGDGNTAVIEMASASGLPLVTPEERNPLNTTTFGTGQLIRAALDLGVIEILIGIGGSATVDCGTGMAQALGVRFYDKKKLIEKHMTGELVGTVSSIDLSGLDRRIKKVTIKVACDVDNPLLGDNGAARVYGPQKGATPEIVEQLEQNMSQVIDVIEAETNPVRDIAGAGAAGGLGAGLLAFLSAQLTSGIEAVLQACSFDEIIHDADLILTGEGKIDEQSAMGKTIDGVVSHAAKYNVPVIAIGGTVFDAAEKLYEKGLLSMFSICNKPMTLQQALDNADALVEKSAERVIRLFAKR